MSLLWRRAGHLRAAFRVCCTTPSRNLRAVWRCANRCIAAAWKCFVIIFFILFFYCLTKTIAFCFCPRCWGSGRGCVEARISPVTSHKLSFHLCRYVVLCCLCVDGLSNYTWDVWRQSEVKCSSFKKKISEIANTLLALWKRIIKSMFRINVREINWSVIFHLKQNILAVIPVKIKILISYYIFVHSYRLMVYEAPCTVLTQYLHTAWLL